MCCVCTVAEGRELYYYDGTVLAVGGLVSPGAASGLPTGLTIYNGNLYFAGTTAAEGVELRVHNPASTPSALLVQDLEAGAASSRYVHTAMWACPVLGRAARRFIGK